MAISAVTIHVNSGAAATSFTSASFTPTASALHIAFLNARTGAAAIPTITDSAGNTWTLVSGTNLSVGAGNLKTATYYWVAGSSPAAMTATVTSAGAIGCSLMLVAYTGASTDTSNIGINQNTAGDPAVTAPSALASVSLGLALNAQNAGAAPTATPSAQGYTSIINSAPTTNLRHTLFTDAASAAQSVSWTSTGTDSIGILWEIKEASTGVTGTIAQTATHAGQTLAGTAIAPPITGTIAQTQNHATQVLQGTATPPAITGTAVQVHKHPTQALLGAFTSAGSFSGAIAQTAPRTVQTLAGTVTLPAISGVIAQTGPRTAQILAGLVAAQATGTITQTAPHVSQALVGFTPTSEPDYRVGGGFANWSTPLDRKRRRAWEEAEEARIELRESLKALISGEEPKTAQTRAILGGEALAAVTKLTEARRDLTGVSELAEFRAAIQHAERAVLRALTGRQNATKIQDGIFVQLDAVEAAQWQALQAFRQEEEAIVALLA